ncbi:hypothetical protein M3Y94_00313400 [Aphelenchoides besseyi]|nr:hypothetical protein M3Y94_00313400 [Aphelenchoides besseyi]
MLCSRICVLDINDTNPTSVIFNFLAACLALAAIFTNFLTVYDATDRFEASNTTLSTPLHFKYFPNGVKHEFDVLPCTVSPRYFLFPAKFSSLIKNGQRHIFYQYDDKTFMDCITPTVSDCFYIVTAFCFVSMCVSIFAAALHLSSPPHVLHVPSYYDNIGSGIFSLLIMYTVSVAQREVIELQRTHQRRSTTVLSIGFYMIVMTGTFSLFAAVFAHRRRLVLRQKRLGNRELMCRRTLRSWRDVPQRQQDSRPVLELGRYLIEPGLRRNDTNISFLSESIELPSNELTSSNSEN